MIAAFDQIGRQAAALHAKDVGGLARMTKARQVICFIVKFDAYQRTSAGQPHRLHGIESVKRYLSVGCRRIGLENIRIESGGDCKGKMRAKGMSRPKQISGIHGLGQPLYSNSEITPHTVLLFSRTLFFHGLPKDNPNPLPGESRTNTAAVGEIDD